MKANVEEQNTMAKVQKTIMIPEELYRLFSMHEKETGVTFSRQALAAMCAYFFADLHGPDPSWIEAVVAYEAGDLTVEQIPHYAACQQAMRYRETALAQRKVVARGVARKIDPDWLDREAALLEDKALTFEADEDQSKDAIATFYSNFKSWRTRMAESRTQPDGLTGFNVKPLSHR